MIQKPGKSTKLAESNRPISVQSILLKLFGKLLLPRDAEICLQEYPNPESNLSRDNGALIVPSVRNRNNIHHPTL